MKTAKKYISLFVISVIVLLLVGSVTLGAFMAEFSLDPSRCDIETEVLNAGFGSNPPGIEEWASKLRNSGKLRDTSIVIDGVELYASFVAAEPNTGKTAISIHGYSSEPEDMMQYARMFRDSLGYNVLLPALRRHGRSGGNKAQMGWLDRFDLEMWITTAHSMFEDSLVVVHGLSMGGAAAMMVCGENLPGYVRGVIDDCGYSTVWDLFSKQLKDVYHLPVFPVLYIAEDICDIKYGWTYKEASSVDQVADCALPMFFIHGDSDQIVPVELVHKLYDSKVEGYKELWIVPGTTHAMAFDNYPDEYVCRVRTFLKDHVE